jgi:hypothetical protein
MDITALLVNAFGILVVFSKYHELAKRPTVAK